MSHESNEFKIDRYVMGAEEFSLALGLIGKTDEGRAVLSTTHKNLQDLDVNALLASASHSLLARGLCKIGNSDQPILEESLEKAMRMLVDFDELLQVNVGSEAIAMEVTIHIRKLKYFCAHWIRSNPIHQLECAPYRHLGAYLMEPMGIALSIKDQSHPQIGGEVPISLLSTSIEAQQDEKKILSFLEENGWSAENAEYLASDIVARISRGSIIKLGISSNQTEDEITAAQKSGLFFLLGSQYDWAFSFPSLDPSAMGQARAINKSEFETILEEFLK